jgi:secreted trypsin-like serine protease
MTRLESLATGRRVLLACCAASLLALIVPAGASAVIGGKTIRASRYPGVVQVIANDFAGGQGTLCGGALIAPRLVVTAGHCFLHVPFHSLRPVSVVFGRQWSHPHKNPPTGIRIGVVRVAHAPINPKLRQSFPDDVEVLYLRRAAPVKPLKLGSRRAARAGAPVFVLGWGLTSNHESELRRNQLHGLTMHVRSDAECRRLAGSEYDSATQICLAARRGAGLQGTCYGDSGSPLLSANGSTVLGTVSTSNNFCGKGASIYTRLTSGPLRRWVDRQIKASRRSSAAPPAAWRGGRDPYGYTGQLGAAARSRQIQR